MVADIKGDCSHKDEIEIFETIRDFYKKFPRKFYICSNCGYLNNDAYTCKNCGWRANGLFKTMGKGYKYTIQADEQTYEIFKPIEILKEKKNV